MLWPSICTVPAWEEKGTQLFSIDYPLHRIRGPSMSSEPSNDSNGRFQGSVMTHVYDASGHLTSIPGEARTVQLDWYGRGAEGAVPVADGPLMPHQPRLRHTFQCRRPGQ